MGNKLLIVASKGYGNYVKEIAESMGCFDEISFVAMTGWMQSVGLRKSIRFLPSICMP